MLLDVSTRATTPVSGPKPGDSAVFSPDGRLLAIRWERDGLDNSITAGIEVVGVPGAGHRRALVVTAPKGFAVTAIGWSHP